MPEITPVISATNHFNLPDSFGTKASETSEFQAFNPVFDGSGNYLCSAQYDTGDTFSQDADYCGAGAPDIKTALGRFLTEFGNVETAGIVQKLDLTFAAGIQANAKIEGHQHATNPHVLSTIDAPTLRVANVASIIPAAAGLGVPLLIVVAGDVSPVNATVSFEMEHVDKPGASGAHFIAQNMRCRVSLSIDYEGTLGAITAGDWLNIIVAKSHPNDDTPTSTLTCEQFVDVAIPLA